MKKILSFVLLCATILLASCSKDDEQTTMVTSVSLDKTKLLLVKGSTATLTATIAPDDAGKDVTWMSCNESVATVNGEGVVTAVAGGKATITVVARNGGKSASCEVMVDYIEVNGIKVAIGNLVANGANGAKIGAPSDGGLYFQFGSLIGWAGGVSGDGTGVPASTSPGYTFNAVGTVVPSGKSIPTTWGDPDRWTGQTGTVPAANDPCTHYLGSDWRLPTKDEYKTLFENHGYTSNGPWTWDAIAKSATNSTKGLTFPASGCRSNSDGSLNNVGAGGYYWSALSSGVASDGYCLYFLSSYLSPSITGSRALGYPVRCVR